MRDGAPKTARVLGKHSDQIRVRALGFGDFHLGQQMKVTRPSGRNPVPQRNKDHFVPKILSPASPNPGMMYPTSFK